MGKYGRHIYSDAVDVDGVLEVDLLTIRWDLFEVNYPIGFDVVRVSDIQRPDMMSLRLYNNMSYWWVIAKFNDIDDWWNDLYVGMNLLVPSIKDIEAYYRRLDMDNKK